MGPLERRVAPREENRGSWRGKCWPLERRVAPRKWWHLERIVLASREESVGAPREEGVGGPGEESCP